MFITNNGNEVHDKINTTTTFSGELITSLNPYYQNNQARVDILNFDFLIFDSQSESVIEGN